MYGYNVLWRVGTEKVWCVKNQYGIILWFHNNFEAVSKMRINRSQSVYVNLFNLVLSCSYQGVHFICGYISKQLEHKKNY